MRLIDELQQRYPHTADPFIVTHGGQSLPADVLALDADVAAAIRPGDVVALIGDFDARSIRRLLTILDAGCIYVPLTADTRPQHAYFFEAAKVDVVIDGNRIERIRSQHDTHPLLTTLRERGHPGLVFFSSGSTGMPKAILHDFEKFLERYRIPRTAHRTLTFLLFDHIGGVNTLFHTMFNHGTVIIPRGRSVDDIVQDMREFHVEILPTTPTFLRMMLLAGAFDHASYPALTTITYSTERMDEASLAQLCASLPTVEFRQTYGMSEMGVMRVKSVARDSVWIHVGGDGVETRIEDGVLKIRSDNSMLGYMNAPSPFDAEGWYDTKDLVEQREDGAIRIVGRTVDWINIGGEKILPEVVERAAMEHPDVLHAQAKGAPNPLTGQHIELTIELAEGRSVDRAAMKAWLKQRLPAAFQPQRIAFGPVPVSHRFKRLG